MRDTLGTIGARTGLFRNNYKITPGLYALGKPNPDSPVLVTANYKLTVDAVRSSLTGISAWLLVVDTRGINVWCAAGKGTFSTEEIVYQVKRTRLSERVSHRTLILPQLSAPGVSSLKLRKGCGFESRFGPIRITDLPAFLENGMQADEQMRSITFPLRERLVLIPVEICLTAKPIIAAILIVLLLSGITPEVYSLTSAISRTGQFLIATMLALLAGAVITPVFLPWLPVRQFWLKGLLAAVPAGVLLVALLPGSSPGGSLALPALILWIMAAASYLAMNFTGSTPYTSLTGVGVEMRRGLPVQAGLAFFSLLLWLASPFV